MTKIDIVYCDSYTAIYENGKLSAFNDDYVFTYADGLRKGIKERDISEIKEHFVDEDWFFDDEVGAEAPELFEDMKLQKPRGS